MLFCAELLAREGCERPGRKAGDRRRRDTGRRVLEEWNRGAAEEKGRERREGSAGTGQGRPHKCPMLCCISTTGHVATETPPPVPPPHALRALTLQHRGRGVVVERDVLHQVLLRVEAGQLGPHQHRLARARGPHQHDRPPPLHEPLQEVAHADGLARVHHTSLQ